MLKDLLVDNQDVGGGDRDEARNEKNENGCGRRRAFLRLRKQQ